MRPILPSRFESTQTLRETATSWTFVATDHVLGRNNVVVKAIRRGNFTQDRSLLVDAFSWGRGLRHPHIAEILDAGLTPKGDLFYVRDFAAPTQLFATKDMELLNVLLGAVDFLHAMGRVHGSIKPSNVLASGKAVRLADPWIPQPLIDPTSEEEVRFSAPEVLKGHPRTVEADLYSVGALLYRFYSGRDLFDDADLESLTSRYIWASPRPLTSISYVSRTIADIVENLIHKDPARRMPAFEALKNELRVQSTAALRSPVIGMTEPIEKGEHFLQESVDRLRVLVVEAPVGFGKTRYIEELRHRMALRAPNLVFSACPPMSRSPHITVAQWLLSVFERHCSGFEDPSVRRLQAFVDGGLGSLQEYGPERLTHDVVDVIGSIARKNPLTLVVEDIDRTNKKVSQLFDSIVSRITRLRLCIIVTSRPGGIAPRTLQNLKDYVGSDTEHIPLGFLSDAASESIASFLERDADRRSIALRKSGGNPLFIEEYCRHRKPSVPPLVRSTISKLMSALPKQSRRVAEVLSLFEEPVSLDVLRQVAAIPDEELEQQLSQLRNLGLCDESIAIPHIDTRLSLHSRISKSRRTKLHAFCYEQLETSGTNKKNLARHAYLGGLFEIASSMYIDLAQEVFRSRKYEATARFYQFVQQCRTRNSSIPLASIEEVISLARCRSYLGDPSAARDALRPLIEMRTVRADPESLSSVYSALSSPLIEPSNAERIRLLELAIGCVGPDTQALGYLCESLASALLLAGRVDDAEMALDRVVRLGVDRTSLGRSDAMRILILAHRGRFREAEDFLSHRKFESVTPFALKSNLALCLEQLGKIREARNIQVEVLHQAKAQGTSMAEIMCLGNLGSIETKLGNIGEAQSLLESAMTKFERMGRRETAPYPAGTCYSDAALHWIERGSYRSAIHCLAQVRLSMDRGFRHEAFQFFLARCELYLALGQIKGVSLTLTKSQELGSSGGFFDVERRLIQSRVEDPSEDLCRDLRQAVETSRTLETRYQRCRLLLALAKNLSSLGASANARIAASEALDIARQGGYRLLAAQAFMRRGLAAEDDTQKQSDLNHCLQEASVMGLQPLMAECAFHIGAWRASCGDHPAARDYLFKSVAITTRLAKDLSVGDRKRFLSLQLHQEARRLLEDATNRTEEFHSVLREPLGKEDLFFGGVYRLTSALTSTSDFVSTVSTLIHSIRQCIPQASIVILENGKDVTLYPLREGAAENIEQRATSAFRRANNRIYFANLGKKEDQGSAVWVPIPCLSLRAGIYIECPDGHATLGEQEIQFLTVSAAIAGAALDQKIGKRPRTTVDPTQEFSGIIGISEPMKKVYADIGIASRNSATVLIEGESGTGKELVAKAIHSRSVRADAPFVPVDCGALPESLIEAELFGTRKGSFTGAVEDRRGLFEGADRGTIFLDEIANASLALQTKLLRVLQEREIRRLGDTKGRRIDVRLIAATNCNLEKLVEEGKFRQDLLFRLKVLDIQLPPLRERKEDIPLLAIAFLNRLNTLNQTRKDFGAGAIGDLLTHDYRGNVRELQNAVERSFYATAGQVITQIAIHKPGAPVAEAHDETEFLDLTEGRGDFWSSVRDRYKRRDISRERVVALVDRGLRSTQGNYKAVASLFNIKDAEYRRFMDFLRRNDFLLDFRPYRRAESRS